MVKKGFLLTFLGVMFVFVIFGFFQLTEVRNVIDANPADSARHERLNSFAIQLEQFFLPNIARVAVRSATGNLLVMMRNDSVPIDDDDNPSPLNSFSTSAQLEQAMLDMTKNGYYASGPSVVKRPEIEHESLQTLLAELETNTLNELGIELEVNYSENYFSIGQTDRWNFNANITFFFNLSDPNTGEKLWQDKVSISKTRVPIEGFMDPLFIYNSIYVTPPIIQRTQIEAGFFSHEALQIHVDGQFYEENRDHSPSFLNRMINDVSSDPQGIETIINPTLLDPLTYPIAPTDRVYVDHLFLAVHNCGAIGDDDNLHEVQILTPGILLPDTESPVNYLAKYTDADYITYSDSTRRCPP